MGDRESMPGWLSKLAEGTREEWPLLVAGQALVGLLLVGLGVAGLLPARGLAGFAGCFLLVYALLILLQHPGTNLLGDRLQRRVHAAITSSGVGFYGVLCLSRFVQLELHDLIEAAAEFEPGGRLVQSLIRDWLIGFSVESLMNSIQAAIWPVQMFGAYGLLKAGPLLAALWALYRFGGWLFPDMQKRIESKEDDVGEASEDAEGPPQPGPPPPPPPSS